MNSQALRVPQVLASRVGRPSVRRVLLVDSDEACLDSNAAYLRRDGSHVLAVSDPEQAWELALTSHPDVIVSDVRLRRGFDGLELTHRLNAHVATAAIPIVLLTGFVFPQHDKVARLAGCVSCLTKPCLPSTLLDEIERTTAAPHARRRDRVPS